MSLLFCVLVQNNYTQ